MCGAPATPPIEVTDDLRAACPGWSDSKILTELADMAWEKEAGFTYLDTLSDETTACWTDGCVPCKVAILDYIWGR